MKCTIIYATESGTSQEISEKLSRDLSRQIIGFKSSVIDIQNYDFFQLPHEKFVIFVLSTAGHGEVPDTMKPFWSFLLRKDLPSNSLSGLKFTVLGLGDSSYATYNYAAKKLYSRLLQLSAQSVLRRGDADDQHDLGIDYELERWTNELVKELTLNHGFNLNNNLDHLTLLPPKFKLTISNNNNNNIDSKYIYEIPSHLNIGTLTVNKRITDKDWQQDVRHLEIEIPTNIKYIPGDVAYIFPRNPDEKVNEIINLLNLDPNILILDIQPLDYDLNQKPNLIKLPISIFDLFKNYFDILGSPKRYFFELLGFFSSDELEKDRLQHFASRDGSVDLRDYNQNEKRNYIDVLNDFESVLKNIPLDYLFDLIPPIKPRPFSISSSISVHKNRIHITAGIHTFKAPLRQLVRVGLCSDWFSSLDIGSNVSFYIKESGARLPSSSQIPIIMVGPGTGCAIFRSFIQQRSLLDSSDRGDTVFYFGCRHESKDYLYEQEWKEYLESGVLSSLRVAFSRDSEDNKKLYVQSLIREDSKYLWKLINELGAYFYISGSSGRMPKDVKHALLLVIKENLQSLDRDNETTYEMALNYFEKNLELKKRFITETW